MNTQNRRERGSELL